MIEVGWAGGSVAPNPAPSHSCNLPACSYQATSTLTPCLPASHAGHQGAANHDRLGAAQDAEPHRSQRARQRQGQAGAQEEDCGRAGVVRATPPPQPVPSRRTGVVSATPPPQLLTFRAWGQLAAGHGGIWGAPPWHGRAEPAAVSCRRIHGARLYILHLLHTICTASPSGCPRFCVFNNLQLATTCNSNKRTGASLKIN